MSNQITPLPAEPLFGLDDGGELVLRHDGCAPLVMAERIVALMEWLLEMKGEHIDLAVEHHRVDGMYLRKLFIPKGTLLVGKLHLKPCMNVVAKGDISVLTAFGSGRLREGAAGPSPAGVQKVGLAHADTVFINVFRTDLHGIADIEAEIAAMPSSKALVHQGDLVCL